LGWLTPRRLVLAGGAGVLAGLGLSSSHIGIDRSKTIVVAVPTDPVSIDPGRNSAELIGSEIILNIFDTLVAWAQPRFDVLEGRLALYWTISQDGRTYGFRLRDGVRFHDGTPLNAMAVKISLERTYVLNPYMRASFEAIEAIIVEGTHDLTIRLSRAIPFFLSLLAQPQAAIVSPTAVQRLGAAFGRAPVGTGAFRFRHREPDVSITLDGNTDYFRGPPKLSHLVYTVVADASTRRFQLENGDIDVSQQAGQLAALPMEDLKAFRSNREIQVVETPSQILRQLEFNNNSATSPTRDIRVRRAMAYAVDYDGLIQGILNGSVDRAYGPLPSSNWAFDTGIIQTAFRYDPQRARDILREAGYAPGALKFEIYTFLGTFWATVATFLQANFAAVGIKVNIRQVEFPSLRALHLAGRFDMALDGRTPWYNDPDAHITIGYLSSLANTAMTFRMPPDAALDRLILDAQTQMDTNRRRRLYADVQREVMARIPALYLFSNKVIIFARADIRGLKVGGAPPLTEYWGVYRQPLGAGA
jgi:peptide/nickel transport system substrate-binding protein